MLALALVLAAAGCGGGEAGGGESYASLIHGLMTAATSHRSYDAVHRPADLDAVQRASLDAFCETTREMLRNGETYKLSNWGYYLSRIKRLAEEELPFVSASRVNRAVDQMESLFGLRSFDDRSAKAYARACYR